MTDTDRDLAVIADYMRRRGAVPLPAGLMAAARERALRQAPERDTARASLAAFWIRGPVAIAGALGALATVAVLLVVLSGLPLGGTDAPAADPSLDGQPLSSPAASTSSTVVCGRIEADACQTAIDLVRDGHPREVAEASAIVVDDTCPPDATCDREYAFEVAVVLVPAEDVLRDVVALRVFGAAGPDQAGVWSGALPQHVIRLIPGAQAPVPAGTPAACPEALIEGTLVADERWGMALAGTDGLRRKVLWPHGYTARREAGGLVLYDAGGSVVAREGDVVAIGGGETGSDGPWLACGGISVVSRAEGTAPASSHTPVPTEGLGSLARSDRFWDALATGPEGAQQWPTLAEVVEVSDLVVRGRVTDIRLGRTVAAAGIQFALTTVDVEEVLKGTPATRTPGTIEVEWWLANGADLTDLRAQIPEHEALFFLFNQGLLSERLGNPEDVEQYRFQYTEVNGAQGTLRDIHGTVRPIYRDRIGLFPDGFVGDSYVDLVQEARDAVRERRV